MTATGNMCRKFREIWTWLMKYARRHTERQKNKQTHKQTR